MTIIGYLRIEGNQRRCVIKGVKLSLEIIATFKTQNDIFLLVKFYRVNLLTHLTKE